MRPKYRLRWVIYAVCSKCRAEVFCCYTRDLNNYWYKLLNHAEFCFNRYGKKAIFLISADFYVQGGTEVFARHQKEQISNANTKMKLVNRVLRRFKIKADLVWAEYNPSPMRYAPGFLQHDYKNSPG